MSASHAIESSTFQNVERFVSADAAAMFLGITRRTLLQKVREGKISAHPLDPSAQRKEWRFKLSELDRVLGARLNSCEQPT
jgi:excisionase family DNA binding protein